MTELHELTAGQQVDALRAREVSAGDLTEHYLARIDEHNDELGAFLTVAPEHALAAAAQADERLARGERAALLGLPIGIKDLFPTAGMRTTFGSAALADHVPADDSWTVGLIREAGAVILGKTNTSELGSTCFVENELTPRPAATPYATDRYASGSSGGAAAAVAAGLLPVAHGSDGAGSIRTPASVCHLVGVKPSRGLVSGGPSTSFVSITVEGPIARTVADAALLLDVMARPHPADLFGWSAPAPFGDAARQEPKRPLKVAMWTDTGVPGVAAHPEAERAVHGAAEALRGLGHKVEQIAVPAPYDEPVRRAIDTMFGSLVATAVHAAIPAQRRDLITPYNRHLLAVGETLSGADIVAFQTALARYAGSFLAVLADFDVCLTPTTNGPPLPFGHFATTDQDEVADLMLAWSCYTPWTNLAGTPAVSLPSHLDEHGLPHGIHLVGRQRHDVELIALAAQLEHALPTSSAHPSCWLP